MTKAASYISIALQIGMLLVAVWTYQIGRPINSLFIIVIALLMFWFSKYWRQSRARQTLPYFELLVTSLIFLDILGFAYLFDYDRTPWWDDAMHFLVPLTIGLLLFFLLFQEKQWGQIKLNSIFSSLFLFSLIVTLCVIWELLEYGVDLWFDPAHPMQSDPHLDPLADTMSDLLWGTLGAFLLGLYVYWQTKKTARRQI